MTTGSTDPPDEEHYVVIVGGGAGGISVASSLHKRDGGLDIVIIEPGSCHHYQPGWIMIEGGVFSSESNAPWQRWRRQPAMHQGRHESDAGSLVAQGSTVVSILLAYDA